MKTALIIILLLAFIIGGLLTLRSTARSGLPGEDVIKRVKEREKRLEDEEKHQP